MRCKCCDGVITRIKTIEVEGQVIEDPYCNFCINASYEEWNYSSDHIHVLQSAKDGPTPPKLIDY